MRAFSAILRAKCERRVISPSSWFYNLPNLLIGITINNLLINQMKKYLLTAVAAMAAIGVSAQDVAEATTETYMETVTAIAPDARSNWFISLGAGPQIFFGDHDKQAKFGDRISPALDFSVGKWFSPSIGVRLMYSGLNAKGATQTWNDPNGGVYNTGKEVPGKYTHDYGYLSKSKFNFLTLHADVMFDLTNIIGGYNASRVYGIAPYIGVGWGHVSSSPKQNSVVGNVGVYNMFHVCPALDVNLDIRASVTDDEFDGEHGRRNFDGLLSVTAGITYRFAPRGWKSRVMKVVEYDNSAVNDLRRRVNELIAQNEKLEKEMAGKTVQHNTVVNANGNYLIYFPINVSSLSNADRAQLEQVANMIKATPSSTVFCIKGYADKSTGSAELNETLSRERAQSVREYLVNEFNIPADRFDVSWSGGVGNMFFEDPALSRVVIISQKK